MEKIRQKTIVEQVMEQIRELVASGKYKPGDKLPTEAELAESFGIGRSSIREAIKIFNYMGILKSTASKGTYLEQDSNIATSALAWSILLGNHEFLNLIDLRGAIELFSIISVTRDLSNDPEKFKDFMDLLTSDLNQMREYEKLGDIEKIQDMDYMFHAHVVSGANNEVFDSIYSVLKSFMLEEINKVYQNYPDYNHLIENHQKLINAILTKNSDDILRAFSSHIDDTKHHVQYPLE